MPRFLVFVLLAGTAFLAGCAGGAGSPSNTNTLQSADPTSGLNFVIKNFNTSYNDSNVYFSFRVAPVQGTINGQPLVEGQVYSLAQIGSGIQLQSFNSGRIYFSLGSPLPVSTNDPEPVNPSVSGYNVRFDKIEITYSPDNPTGTANLTTIDYFGIPLAIQTYTANSASPQQALTFTVPGNTVINALAQLAGNSPQVLLKSTSGSFLRVLGPTKAPSGSYPSFQSYINQVVAGPQLQIEDLYSSLGSTPRTVTQCYNFTTAFDGNGNLDLNGGGFPYNNGQSVGPNHQIVIQAGDLAAGVYSANPPYTVDGAAAEISDNDVYAAAVRDVLAAFGFGFMNSSTIDPNTNKAFNTEPSAYWWQSPKAFAFLQPAASNYNQYASYLYSISSSYGQPFSDRWQTVQAKLDPSNIATMEIDILPDTGPVTVQPNPGPPAPKALYCAP